jgi:(S)-ureidoglycine aminohydrolase
MKKIIVLIISFCPLLLMAQKDSLLSKVYEWKKPTGKLHNKISSSVLFEGSTYDIAWLQMNAIEFAASGTVNKMTVPADQEQLYIIKKGILTVGVNDSTYPLVKGSVALLLPGQNFSIQNKNVAPCDYYIMKYRSKSPTDLQRGKDSGGSFIKDWNKIEFNANEKGGTRKYFQCPTAMCKRLEMHATTLNAALKSHAPHTHHAQEIIVVFDGDTEMQIGQQFYKGNEGDVYYLGALVLHGIRNIGSGSCTYLAFQFE